MDAKFYLEKVIPVLEQFIPVVKQTAEAYIQERAAHDTMQKKGQGNFVTPVDLLVDTELRKRLADLLPDAGFITEETENREEKKEYTWIIDPIDGTTNMLHGLPYTVSVALSGPQGVEFGAVAENDTLYYAVYDGGSYRKKDGETTRIHVGTFPEKEGLTFFGMPYDRNRTHTVLALAEQYHMVSSDLKRIGPASLDICRVAEGTAKVYFEADLKVWDMAAGILILQEAGGYTEEQNGIWFFSADKKYLL